MNPTMFFRYVSYDLSDLYTCHIRLSYSDPAQREPLDFPVMCSMIYAMCILSLVNIRHPFRHRFGVIFVCMTSLSQVTQGRLRTCTNPLQIPPKDAHTSEILLGAILVGLGAYVRFSDTSSTHLGHPQRPRRTKHPKTGATNIHTARSKKGRRVPRRASNCQK